MQIAACDALINLAAKDSDVQIQVVTGDGLAAILNAMDALHDDVDVQEHACTALAGLTDPLENQHRVVRSGAVARVLSAMDNHFAVRALQHAACVALWNLSEDSECAAQIAAAGAVLRLCQAMDLFPRESALQIACCGAVMNLSSDPFGKVPSDRCSCEHALRSLVSAVARSAHCGVYNP